MNCSQHRGRYEFRPAALSECRRLVGSLVRCALLSLVVLRPVVYADSSVAQNANRIASTNCGRLLVRVTSRCASKNLSSISPCCAALNAWSEGLCWCEPHAFSAVTNLAMDYYAFMFRAEKCRASSYIRPAITLPSGGKTIEQTCPHVRSAGGSDLSEGCGSGRNPEDLRAARLQSLKALLFADLRGPAGLDRWSKQLDSVLAPDVSLFSIGFVFSYPRVRVKEYLLARSTYAGGALWQSTRLDPDIFWRSPDKVSYSAALEMGPFSFDKIEFVKFETCSPRILEVHTQEEEPVRLFKQFVYFDAADRTLLPFNKTPIQWCRIVQKRCKGTLFPYDSLHDCMSFYQHLKEEKRVVCRRDGDFVPQVALHGDTTSCRGMYLDLARVAPARYCPNVGRRARGRCSARSCPGKRYEDVFRLHNPRYLSSGGFNCSSSGCNEIWPAESMDDDDDDNED